MKNNKGFTVIELAVSFCLVSAIAILLFQVVLSLKDLYISGTIKTTMLNRQGIMTKKINDELEEKKLNRVESCGISCLRFTYIDNSTADLLVDPYLETITFDNYTIKLTEGSSFGTLKTEIYSPSPATSTDKNSVMKISIPITNKFADGDYGIYVVYGYNNNTVYGGISINNDLPINNVILSLDGINMETKLFGSEANSNISFTNNQLYAHIFHHYSNNGSNVFNNIDNLLKSNNTNMFSGLGTLKVLTGKYSSDIETTTVDESKYDSFDFLLGYPSLSTTGYNNWVQTSNPTTDKIAGYQPKDILWQGTNGVFGGLEFNGLNHAGAFIDGAVSINDYYFAIGQKKATDSGIMGPTGVTQTVDLWIRIDDYIDKYSLSNIVY